MSPTIYALTGDFPTCRKCGREMDWWSPWIDWDTHEHDDCNNVRSKFFGIRVSAGSGAEGGPEGTERSEPSDHSDGSHLPGRPTETKP